MTNAAPYRLSDDAEAELIQAADDEAGAMWTVGRVSAREVDHRQPGTEMGTVRNRVADVAGCSAETVRHREAAARFWPQDVVDDYPALYFRHFVVAMTGTTSLAEACKRLDVAVASADSYGGRPMPVRVMEAKYLGGDPITAYNLHDALDSLVTKAAAILQRRDVPPHIARKLQAGTDLLREGLAELQQPAGTPRADQRKAA